MKSNGICKLCGKFAELEESHIIPSFIYSWLKDTSGTGFLRFGQIPNKRVQDGLKENWLCPKCEDLFNMWETKFANIIFYPMVNRTSVKFNYGDWFLKFMVSLSWRVLSYFKEKTNLSHLSQDQKNETELALGQWKKFLLGEESNPGKYQQHAIPLDVITKCTSNNLPSNMNRYFLRAVDIELFGSKISKKVFVYVKIPRMLLVGFIQMKPNQWKNTKIHVKKGEFGAQKYVLPTYLMDCLTKQAIKTQNILKNLSGKQQLKIEQTFKNNPNRFKNSDSLSALRSDVELFGETEVFED